MRLSSCIVVGMTLRDDMAQRCGLNPGGPDMPGLPSERLALFQAHGRCTGRTTTMLVDVLVAVERGETPLVVMGDSSEHDKLRKLGEKAGVPTGEVKVLDHVRAKGDLCGSTGPVFVDHWIRDQWLASRLGICPTRMGY